MVREAIFGFCKNPLRGLFTSVFLSPAGGLPRKDFFPVAEHAVSAVHLVPFVRGFESPIVSRSFSSGWSQPPAYAEASFV